MRCCEALKEQGARRGDCPNGGDLTAPSDLAAGVIDITGSHDRKLLRPTLSLCKRQDIPVALNRILSTRRRKYDS
ncbi:hypothetical protein DF3PA_20096 [Candidatus Defluviicoccus seviourii]|uniref:Uncharacterized protein n=1 Tax=Candidatus Defluviicoccus seviourii TaxID=2565273 RepID=A0A564WCJ3_9PROT|nr:hypothetical protein DF3PA_20096 [Candidatus Defluviicoccus seviourii]